MYYIPRVFYYFIQRNFPLLKVQYLLLALHKDELLLILKLLFFMVKYTVKGVCE